MALLQPKVPFWVFPCACWNPIFVICGDFVWLRKKVPFSKNRLCQRKCAFLTFRSQMLFANSSKNAILTKQTFYFTTTLFFCFVFVTFSFSIVFILSLFFSNTKKTETRNAHLFSNPLFGHPSTCKHIKFSQPYTLYVILQIPKAL